MSAIEILSGSLTAEHVYTSGIVKMIAGDSFIASLYLNKGTELEPSRYTLNTNDTVYFAISQMNESFMESIVRKVYTSSSSMSPVGDLIIYLDPSDTASLEEGTYYYSVKVVTTIPATSSTAEKSIVNTVIPNTLFYILP